MNDAGIFELMQATVEHRFDCKQLRYEYEDRMALRDT